MPIRFRSALIITWCLVGLNPASLRASEPVDKLTFERHVRPILKEYCFDCHGAGEKLQGGLDLRLRRYLVQGGDNGAVVVPGDPAKSVLLHRLKAGEMPPSEKKVPAEKIAVIEQWLRQGAITLRQEPENLPLGNDITPEERAYWFYQPIRRPELPQVADADRVRTPIDAVVLDKLRGKGLPFNPDADRLTLLRRASLDLIGLPPTPQEVEAYLSDSSANAYEKALDRLLASPHYGERWARHWLDVAGYADSDGDGSNDTPRLYAWRYRDYVIRAIQSDKPLNQFIIEQLAGDELLSGPWTNLRAEQIDLLAATGFLRMAPDATSSGGGAAEANQVVADTLKIVGSSLLGLSVGCAQCHDHRYDPIPQADYFRLRAIFEPALDPARWRRPSQRLVSLYTDADRAKAAAIEAEAQQMQADYNAKQQKHLFAALEKVLTKYPKAEREQLRAAYHAPGDKRTDAQKKLLASNPSVNISPGVLYQYDEKAADELKKLQAAIKAKRNSKPVEQFVAILNEIPGQLGPTRIFHRGDYRQLKSEVQPGDLTIAAPEGHRLEISAKDAKLPTSGRRLAYARHLTSGRHPLVGRVLANRIWFHHFGRGIVDTPGDFGILGQRPTHPELLDWLADELPRQGWSLKAMHKLIMTSTVYRQAAQRTAAQDAVDSGNVLYGRYPLRRLEAEALRDRILATTGRLDRTLFGAPVSTMEDVVGQVIVPDDRPRRSIYVEARRSKPVAFLTTFDAPAGELNCDRRMASTSAPQSLMLMNSDFLLRQAGHFARRLKAETPADFARDQVAQFLAKYPRAADAWQYGFAEYDPTAKRMKQFTPLPHWTGSSWQGGPALPDPKHGWVIVHAQGGHAGNDHQHASIRRWIAPRDGTLAIVGKLQHSSPNGDGVRGRIVSGGSGLHSEWSVKNREAVTNLQSLTVKTGDHIDFAVDCQGDVTSDSYVWTLTLSLSSAGAVETWNSAADFRGPAPAGLPQLVAQAWQMAYQRPASTEELDFACRFLDRQARQFRSAKHADPELAALTNLCQQLLSSNEFLYVD